MLPVGLVAALTILSRLDNIFLVGMAGIWLVFRRPKLNGLLLADLAFFYLTPITAAFWRLKPGAEYYQYLTSVYIVLAVSLAGKTILFEIFDVYRFRAAKSWVALAIRIIGSLILCGWTGIGFFGRLKAVNVIPGYPGWYRWPTWLFLRSSC
jgi:hypothetical protein